MTKDILEKTKELFEIIAKLQTDDEKLPYRTEIYRLNYSIVQNELIKRKRRYNDMMQNVADDLHSAISEGLWTAILRYDLSKNANLYTFATPFINNLCSEVIRSEVTKNTLSEYDWSAYCRAKNIIEETATASFSEFIAATDMGPKQAHRCYRLVSGCAYPMINSDVALVSCTYTQDEFKRLEDEEWIGQLRKFSCRDDVDRWLFDWIMENGNQESIAFHAARALGCTRRHAKLRVSRLLMNMKRFSRQENCRHESVCEDDLEFMPQTARKNDAEIIDLDEFVKGGKTVDRKEGVPKVVRQQTADLKLETSIDLGIRQYIDERVREKIDEMSVDEITSIVVDSLKSNR